MKLKVLIILLILLGVAPLFSQSSDIFDVNGYYQTVFTMDVLNQPYPPGFLDDYSAPGQKLWNSQVMWMTRKQPIYIIIKEKDETRWMINLLPRKKYSDY